MYDFQTAPQIYTPTAPVGQRWSQLLTDSGIDRGYHNSALLIASGEVRTQIFAGSQSPCHDALVSLGQDLRAVIERNILWHCEGELNQH